ncbi:MAG: polysaccharide biosynthesis/export family protein [Deltaproteobacteria bacterium]
MNAPRIVPCRDQVSPRFPDASFHVQVPPGCGFEVACATDPRLFARGASEVRRDHSFYAASGAPARASSGHAVWVLPTPVLRRFGGIRRLYYLAAATGGRAVSLSAPLHSPPWLRIAPDFAGSARFGSPGTVAGRLRWAGDLALADDEFSDLGDEEDMGPPPLAKNQVVAVEVRDPSGAVAPGYSHEYPVKGDPTAGEDGGVILRIPDLQPFRARELKLVDLRKQVQAALVAAKIFPSATVNATLSTKGVAYEQTINPGDTIWLRILGPGGALDKASGSYTVNDGGEVDLPWLGLLKVGGSSLADVEADVLKRVADARLFQGALIDLSLEELK